MAKDLRYIYYLLLLFVGLLFLVTQYLVQIQPPAGMRERRREDRNRKGAETELSRFVVVPEIEEEAEQEEMERLKDSPFIYHQEQELEDFSALPQPKNQKDTKYISFYLPWDKTQKSFKSCKYNQCSYSPTMARADLVAFKAALIRDHGLPTFHRPPHQRWVMFASDPASKDYGFDREEIRAQFNATFTYRLDADIMWMFGRLKKVQSPLHYDYDNVFESKTHQAAWFVSHCHTASRREEYVRRMQDIIPVDVFGLCTNRSCGVLNHRKDDTDFCLPMLSQKYKFYLSFENALCEDYVTEKFFKLFHDVHIVPVVRGGFQYKKHLPSGIFVDASDFKSSEELARYLLDLGNDRERYTRMLRKKSSWQLTMEDQKRHCKLCEYAHTESSQKYIPELKEAFNGDYPHCWPPNDL